MNKTIKHLLAFTMLIIILVAVRYGLESLGINDWMNGYFCCIILTYSREVYLIFNK